MTHIDVLIQLAAEYWDFFLDEHPFDAYQQGDARGRHALFRESLADYQRREQWYASFEPKLQAVDALALPAEHRNTLLLLKREVSEARERFALKLHLRPTHFPFGPEMYLGYALSGTTLATRPDADDLRTRLRTLPQYFDDYVERLHAGSALGFRLPTVLLTPMLASLDAQLNAANDDCIWLKPLRAAGIAKQPWLPELKAELALFVESDIRPAYLRWREALQQAPLRDSIGLASEPEGEAVYRFLARQQTTGSVPPEEIHRLGLAEVQRIARAMQALASNAQPNGSLASFRQSLRDEPNAVAPSGEALRERIEVLAKRIDLRLPETFGQLPRMSYGVQSIPEAAAQQLPVAYAQPNPASGQSAGIFWVTSLPARCLRYTHLALTLHEAWPGHLMHVALIQEMDSLPAFRRFSLGNYNAYFEGWAMYCEQLGHDMGLYTDAGSHYGQLELEMMRALRLVVDTGIHLQGWGREQAIETMAAYQAQDRAVLAAEVDRYIGMPAQALSYKMGELKIRELRQRAERTLGERFRLRAFNDQLLNCGPVTLTLLDAHVQHWLDQQSAAVA